MNISLTSSWFSVPDDLS